MTMPVSDKTFNRMADVMFALGEAEKARARPTKIQLQKFVYLTDVLSQIVGAMKPREAHLTYRNGPYDPAIQNAVDSLAFRGLVRVTGVWRTPSGHLGTSYALSAPGRRFLQRLRSHPSLGRKNSIAGLVGDELRHLGWDRIVALVYAEPTYVATRPTGWGSPLPAEDGLTVSAAFLVAVMRRVATTLAEERAPSPAWISDRFFAYLSDYDRNSGARREAAV
jgi:hypothetical protein